MSDVSLGCDRGCRLYVVRMHNQETAVVNHDATKETENRIDENKLDMATVNLLLDTKVRFLSYKIT